MLIIVLGGGIDLGGNLPEHVYQRLNKAIELLVQSPQSKVVVCGKYSFLYDQLGKYPPVTEAEKMSDYLINKGADKNKILTENQSKDTIGNAYYLKKNIFLPQNETSATIVTSHFHLERVKYIFAKIFGQAFNFEFIGLQEKLPADEEKKVIAHQKELLEKIKEILSPMKDGDHEYLSEKLYKIKYYREKRPDWVINFVAQGK